MSKQKSEMIPAEQPQAPAPAPTSWAAVRNLAEAIQLAEIVAKSVAIPDVRNAGQALIKILAGAEMGFGPFASLVDVHIIEGKPAIGAKLMAAAIKRSGVYDYAIKHLNNEACAVEFFRHGKSLGSITYTIAEADVAGVSMGRSGQRKDNWRRHPDDMLFARVISKGFRRHCPDLCGGVAACDPDELESGPPAADPRPAVDAEFTVKADAPPPVEPPSVAMTPPVHASTRQVERLKELVELLGFSPKQQMMALKARSVTSFEELSSMRAGEMLEGLEARLKAKQAQESAEQTATDGVHVPAAAG